MQWTDEQREIIEARDDNMVVRARAGTGKTTTLVGYTEARPKEKTAYIVFNSANRKEAEGRFPSHVKPMTSHSLAFGSVGRHFKHKLGDTKPVDVARMFGVGYQDAAASLKTLHKWLSTIESEIRDPLAQEVWNAMQDTQNRMRMPHDGYLKLFVMEGKRIPYDRIVLDEAQDTNPITIELLRQQDKPLVVVGDPYQAIYSFRGAMNALDQFEGRQFHLQTSFRFGPEAAAAANAVLKQFGETHLLEGRGQPTQIFREVQNARSYAYLARTNADVIAHAIAAGDKPLNFVGGLESYRTDKILDAYRLYNHSPDAIQDEEIRKFKNYDALVKYAEEIKEDTPEMKGIIALIEKHGDDLPRQIADIRKRSEVAPEDATITLTTAHRSKGLEWDSVILGDFFDWDDYEKAREKGDTSAFREELNLLYVAATRARKNLVVNDALENAMREAGLPAPRRVAGPEAKAQSPANVQMQGNVSTRRAKAPEATAQAAQPAAELPDSLLFSECPKGREPSPSTIATFASVAIVPMRDASTDKARGTRFTECGRSQAEIFSIYATDKGGESHLITDIPSTADKDADYAMAVQVGEHLAQRWSVDVEYPPVEPARPAASAGMRM